MANNITFTRWSAEGLPEGLTINEETGAISGRTRQPAGTYTAWITIETNKGITTKPIDIVVNASIEDLLPKIDDGQVLSIAFGDEVNNWTISGANVEKTDLITSVRWIASYVPLGMEFSERTGTFSGIPEEAGEYIINVSVETTYGSDCKAVTIIVIDTRSYEPEIYDGQVLYITKGIDIAEFFVAGENINIE